MIAAMRLLALGTLVCACGSAGGGSADGAGGGNDSGGDNDGGGAGGAFTVDGGPGDGPSCAYRAFTAARVPLDLVLLVDASGSMASAVTAAAGAPPQSKWQLAREALLRFMRDPGSAGLGIGLQFFPLLGQGSPCNNAGDCDPARANVPSLCQPPSACVVPGGDLDSAPACSTADGVLCGAGACQPLGTCALAGQACATVGQSCPGGAAGDVCQAQPKTCQSAAVICDSGRYQTLAADVAALPDAALPLARLLAMRHPGGTTPMAEAAIGTLTALRDRLTAMPDRHAALIVATDGLPAGCSNQDITTIADTLYTAANTTPTVPTYVVGVLDAADRTYGEGALGQLARAGNTRAPFIVEPAQDLTQTLQAALGRIRNDALPCEYEIPADSGGAIDYGRVNVHFQGSADAADIPYAGSATQCDPARGGWYYDVDPSRASPHRILTCDATCARVNADAAAKVEIRFGCKTIIP